MPIKNKISCSCHEAIIVVIILNYWTRQKMVPNSNLQTIFFGHSEAAWWRISSPMAFRQCESVDGIPWDPGGPFLIIMDDWTCNGVGHIGITNAEELLPKTSECVKRLGFRQWGGCCEIGSRPRGNRLKLRYQTKQSADVSSCMWQNTERHKRHNPVWTIPFARETVIPDPAQIVQIVQIVQTVQDSSSEIDQPQFWILFNPFQIVQMYESNCPNCVTSPASYCASFRVMGSGLGLSAHEIFTICFIDVYVRSKISKSNLIPWFLTSD